MDKQKQIEEMDNTYSLETIVDIDNQDKENTEALKKIAEFMLGGENE